LRRLLFTLNNNRSHSQSNNHPNNQLNTVSSLRFHPININTGEYSFSQLGWTHWIRYQSSGMLGWLLDVAIL
jgi:hypothetical protein